jgi:3'(2'), 5'-bisphosphate nucleotidase
MQHDDVLNEPAKTAEDGLKTILTHSRRLPLNAPANDTSKHRNLVIAGSRSHATPELEDFVNTMKKAHGEVDFMPAGSSLKFCMLAEGSADIYPRLGATMEWDTAAAQCVLEAAGGSVIKLDGEALDYRKADWRNPHFLAVGAWAPIFDTLIQFLGTEELAHE